MGKKQKKTVYKKILSRAVALKMILIMISVGNFPAFYNRWKKTFFPFFSGKKTAARKITIWSREVTRVYGVCRFNASVG